MDGMIYTFHSNYQQDGAWCEIINMGNSINTDGNERFPNLTPDGKYFFFNRTGDVYWVDAKIIDKLKPDSLKSGEI